MENVMVFVSRQILIDWSYHRGCNDGRVGNMWDAWDHRNAYRALDGKSLRKGHLGKPRQKWIDS
jgi:hypothetical protein